MPRQRASSGYHRRAGVATLLAWLLAAVSLLAPAGVAAYNLTPIYEETQDQLGGSGSAGSTPVALLYRVHFGDLQFLHAMASWDGEAAAVTRAHVLAWLELTYRVNDGEIADLDAPISELVPALRDVFGRNGFSVRSLFVPQSHQHGANADALVRDMALGSLLHTIEDSWSAAPVVAVGRLVLTLLQQHLPWADAAAYFQCVMEIGDPSAQAGPGDYVR